MQDFTPRPKRKPRGFLELIKAGYYGDLPRWARRFTAPKHHTREKENARRRRQIERGILKESSDD